MADRKPAKKTAKKAAKKPVLDDWRPRMLDHVRSLIEAADPDVVEEVKWRKPTNPAGVPTWSHDGLICTGETYKEHLRFTFFQGAALKDPAKLFNANLGKKPKLLSGGNPQVAKADGDAPVQAYLAAIPGWKRDVARRLDALIMKTVPEARKAVKWNSPFYGIEGQGWFVSMHVFTNYVKVTFFRGTSLRPVPPGGKSAEGRWIDVHEDDLDEKQMVAWVRQAAAMPGWGKS